MKNCPICGIRFEASRGHDGEKKFCSLKCYWESKKVSSGYIKAFCIDCGSHEIFNHGVHNIAKKVCKGCFDKRLEKLNQDKNFYKRKTKCIDCGVETKVAETWAKKYKKDGVRCLNCHVLKITNSINHCRSCGFVFIGHSNQIFCDNKCEKKFEDWYSKNNKYFYRDFTKKLCVSCGIELNETTRAHEKSDQQCNECNYITRRIRKDKKKYGEDYLQIVGKTRIIDSVETHFKKLQGGVSSCKGNRLDWERVIQRLEKLFMSEHSKTSLNSILAP